MTAQMAAAPLTINLVASFDETATNEDF